ncbi:MAG: flagellar filament capping protein FliD [Pseudomonadales bacterium]|nr:flagellar filament capping protein FliD [Pseudomonadales bacterium]
MTSISSTSSTSPSSSSVGTTNIGSGTGTVSSLGIGSGILTSSVVDSLISATQGPQQAVYQSQISTLNTKISDYGTLQGLLSTFQSAASALSSSLTSGAKTVTSANTSLASATASSFAQSGSYSLEVDQLASTQQLVTQGYSSATSVVGTGTLSFTTGTTTYTGGGTSGYSFTPNSGAATSSIQITSSNDTLSGIRDAINNANIGVTASIIYNGSTYQLSVASSATGANNSVQIGVTNSSGATDTSTTDLGALAFNSSAVNLSQATAASNASLKVNGIPISSSSNTVGGAINGVVINLLQASVGNPFNLTIAPDTTNITKSVQSLVDSYNAYQAQYSTYTAFNASTGTGGPLMGDPGLQTAMNQITNILGNMVTGMGSASIHSLADIGISTNSQTGQMTFDNTKLASVLQSNPQDVISLLSSNGSTTDSLISYVSNTTATQAGTYGINVTQLATQGGLNGSNGSVTGNVTVASGSNTLVVSVDGNSSSTVTIPAGTYTPTQLAQTLQAQINADSNLKAAGASLSAAYDSTNSRLTLNSNSYGSLSNVDITSINSTLATSLGLTVANGTAGVDVAGTINGVAATGVGQMLTGAKGDASEGLAVQILGGSLGSRGTVTYVNGVGQQLNTALTSILGSNGPFTNQVNSFNSQVTEINTQNSNLTTRMNALRATMTSEFSAYDAMIAQMNSTSSYLASFFNAQSNSSSSSSSSSSVGSTGH